MTKGGGSVVGRRRAGDWCASKPEYVDKSSLTFVVGVV